MKDEDKTYENEVKHSIKEDRGNGDLTLVIDMLTKQKEFLQKRGVDFIYTPMLGDRKPALNYRN